MGISMVLSFEMGNTLDWIRFLGSGTQRDRFRFARSVRVPVLMTGLLADAPRPKKLNRSPSQKPSLKGQSLRFYVGGARSDRFGQGATLGDTGVALQSQMAI